MSEVVVPRALLAVGVLMIAGIALGGVYFYYQQAQAASAVKAIQEIASTIGEATGGGESQTAPISFSGGSVQVVYENHSLSIYYNLSETLGSLPGVGDLRPVIYEAAVEFPILVIDTGSELEPYNDTGPILAVAPLDQGLAAVNPVAYGYSDGSKIIIIPRVIILYNVDDAAQVLNITIVVPKMNVTCSTGSCEGLQGKYTVRVTARIVDILPYPYQSYNPLSEGEAVEASFNQSSPTIMPKNVFGKAPVTSIGLEYDVAVDIKYIVYDIYLERVG